MTTRRRRTTPDLTARTAATAAALTAPVPTAAVPTAPVARHAVAWCVAAALGTAALGASPRGVPAQPDTTRPATTPTPTTRPAPAQPAVQPAMRLPIAPGQLTVLPDGRRIFSLHQWFQPSKPLAELDAQGRLVDFPRAEQQPLPPLAAVLGVKSDTAGVLYILDNGDQGKEPSKVVVYDAAAGRLVRTIPLAAPVVDTNSFISDVAIDTRRNRLYISDPAGGDNAALIVVNLDDGSARRVLQGTESVRSTDTAWTVLGKPLLNRIASGPAAGTLHHPPAGVDGLVLDYGKEWLYYGPLDGRTLYRVRAADLANANLSDAQLAARVERYATKPPSAGLATDRAGNIYLGDLSRNELGVIDGNRQYQTLAPGLPWVADFEWASDDTLYVTTSQLYLSPYLNAGVDGSRKPFVIYLLHPLAPGRQGY